MTKTERKIALQILAENHSGPGLAQVKQSFKKAFDEIDKRAAASQKKSLKAQLDSMKQTFGDESSLKRSVDILKGAGAVAGLTLAANAAASITGHLRENLNLLDQQKISAGQLAENFTRSLPILGGVYVSLQNIAEMMIGIDKIKRDAQQQEDNANKTQKVVVDTKDIVESFRASIAGQVVEMAKQNAATNAARLPGPLSGAAEMVLKVRPKFEVAESEYKAAADKLMVETQTRRADIEKQLRDLVRPSQTIMVQDKVFATAGPTASVTMKEIENPAYAKAIETQKNLEMQLKQIAKNEAAQQRELVDIHEKKLDAIREQFNVQNSINRLSFDTNSGMVAVVERAAAGIRTMGPLLDVVKAKWQSVAAFAKNLPIPFGASDLNVTVQDRLQAIDRETRRPMPGLAGELERAGESVRLEYVQRERELKAITLDVNAALAQRVEARKLLAELPAREAEAVKRAQDDIRRANYELQPMPNANEPAAIIAARERYDAMQGRMMARLDGPFIPPVRSPQTSAESASARASELQTGATENMSKRLERIEAVLSRFLERVANAKVLTIR